MACGVPVVASCVGGIPEIAEDGGIVLVEPGSAEQIADSLQRLLKDSNLRIQVGAKGIQSFSRRFTWTAVCRQYQLIVDYVRDGKVACA
jgi:glycosyltransferase involved in cell wall biosynthesis